MVIELAKQLRSELKKGGGIKLLDMLKPNLHAHNIIIGRDRFFKLLREHDMLQKRRKNYVRITNSDHPYRKWTNLITDLKPNKPQQLWVSDITYLRTKTGFVDLSLVTDAYSRKIVGYHLTAIAGQRLCNRTYSIHTPWILHRYSDSRKNIELRRFARTYAGV